MKSRISAVAMVMIGAMFVGAYSQYSLSNEATPEEAPTEEQQQDFEDLMDRFSYAYGLDLAKKFKAEGVELNVELLAEAMQSVFNDGEKKMSPGEVVATINLYREFHTKRLEKERAIAAKKNKKEGKKFLTQNAKKEDVIVTESGLQYKVIKEGDGGRKPTKNDDVIVHYRGKFVDGTEFESSYSRDEPLNVSMKGLIDGWAEGLKMMSKGAKWELYIPAELAYGERGSDPHIGPNATLIFEVELLDIEKVE